MVGNYQNGYSTGLEKYPPEKAQRFSWWMAIMLHTFPDSLAYDQQLQDMDLAYLFSSE